MLQDQVKLVQHTSHLAGARVLLVMLQDQVKLAQHTSHHLRAEVFHLDDILLAQSPLPSLQLLQGEVHDLLVDLGLPRTAWTRCRSSWYLPSQDQETGGQEY